LTVELNNVANKIAEVNEVWRLHAASVMNRFNEYNAALGEAVLHLDGAYTSLGSIPFRWNFHRPQRAGDSTALPSADGDRNMAEPGEHDLIPLTQLFMAKLLRYINLRQPIVFIKFMTIHTSWP